MKKSFFLFMWIILVHLNPYAAETPTADEKVLYGTVTDSENGMPLAGVSVYLPELKVGAITNQNGHYRIEHLPSSSVVVEVTFVGYKLIVVRIDLNAFEQKDFAMKETVAELNAVIVAGNMGSVEKNRTPITITSISKIQMLQNSSTNIIDAVATQPGIAQITTGSGISKPVIRGLGFNRIVVVNDGIRQEGQQWGDEHGIEIDAFSINRVEILKGPASLAYGSDAMAGVINMLSAPSLPEGTRKGNVLTNYQTNNGLIGFSTNLAGNQKGFIWDVRFSGKMAHAYKNKYDGYVFNSGFRENALSGILGINKSWGYSHLHLSSYQLQPGLISGDRDGPSGKFIKTYAIDPDTEGETIATKQDLKSYDVSIPSQLINHYKAVMNNRFFLGRGNLKTTLGFQQNHRKEYGNVLDPEEVELYFLLNTINYNFQYQLPEKDGLSYSIGVNGMRQTNANKGEEFLIPEYRLFDFGIYTIASKNFNRLDIAGGVRYDVRNQHTNSLFVNSDGTPVNASDSGAMMVFDVIDATYSGISGSIGASYQLNDAIYTKLNLSRGYRAPNITEISANGVHEGAISYLIGVPTLKPENSLQLDLALGVQTAHFTAELNLFNNNISNYIFLQALQNSDGGDSLTDQYRTFKYASGDARLSGGELSLDIHPHPLDWLHFENTFSMVYAVQKGQSDSTRFLPLIPAPRFTSEMKATKKKIGKRLSDCYLKLNVESYLTQNRFYSAFATETETPGYTLINAGLGTEVHWNDKNRMSIFISVNNLFDIGYQSHLNRLKYAADNNATGRTGIYNMGRNISFTLLLPFSKS